MVSCFSWFLQDTHASCACHECLWFPRSPGDQRAGPALCRLRAAGPAAPSSLVEDAACPSPGSPGGGGVYLCVGVGASVCVQRSRGWKWISGRGDAGVRRGEAGEGRGEAGDGRGKAGDGRAGLVPLLPARPVSTEPLVPYLTFNLRKQLECSAFYTQKSFR